VIDSQDAAVIPPNVPGRALVRLSHKAVAAFQAAYSGAAHAREEQAPTAASAIEVPWSALGRNEQPPTAAVAFAGQGATDLAVLVDAMCKAAEGLKIEPQPRPWLQPLPEQITLAELPQPEEERRGGLAPIAIGLQDLPSRQEQSPMMLDLETFTHLYVIGTTRSGRTQALRSLAGALAENYTTADVHLYGIDAAGGALATISELPHAGTVAGRNDVEHLDRLLTRIGQELTRRQELLAEYHSGNLTELRAAMPPGPRPGHLFLLIDGWESLAPMLGEQDSGRLLDGLHRLLREGGAPGVHVVIAGDRGLVSGRIAGLNENRLMLRMSDKNDFLLIGMRAAAVPERVAPGRGWLSGGMTEVQLALLTKDPSGKAQTEALRRIGQRAARRDADTGQAGRPFTVGKLPIGIGFAEAYRLLPEAKPLTALLGVGADETGPVVVDFAGRGHAFLVVGPSGSGRSTTLATLAISLLAARTKLLAVTPRDSPLRRLAVDPNVRVLTNPALTGQDIKAGLEELGAPCVVLIDDLDVLARNPAPDVFLRELIGTGRDRGIGIACAGSAEAMLLNPGSWVGEMRRSRQGLLLNPQAMNEGDLVGARLQMEIIRRPLRLGRGYITNPTSGAAMAVALPLTELREGGPS
jgi:S-DNA-T family DNA segregation ATPase FtsK/SpoIIIE